MNMSDILPILSGVVFCLIGFVICYILSRRRQVKDIGWLKIYRDDEGRDLMVLELKKDLNEVKQMNKITAKVEVRK